ncbi:MAG: glycosyltransferase, partial [Cellulomonas sp.]|nr:glycosyltransferase [Cellulomonas sp.]
AAADLESERLHVWAVGHVESSTRAELRRRAVQLGLGDRFLLTGRVDDALLADVLERADIAVALRTPVLEGQSASVLTQMRAGLPAVVLNHGHYAELPDDAVVKVDPDNVRHGLVDALQRLARDPEERARRGEAARDYAGARNGSAYADAILVAAERALAARPMTVLAADLNRRLERIDLHRQPAVVDLVSDLAFELFDLA